MAPDEINFYETVQVGFNLSCYFSKLVLEADLSGDSAQRVKERCA
jgi:hypothetical protein